MAAAGIERKERGGRCAAWPKPGPSDGREKVGSMDGSEATRPDSCGAVTVGTEVPVAGGLLWAYDDASGRRCMQGGVERNLCGRLWAAN